MKKQLAAALAGLMAITFASCGETAPHESNPTESEGTSPVTPTIETYFDENLDLPTQEEGIDERGQRLLREYNVSYDQIIRFPWGERVYEAHGAAALTSLEAAREKYPDWPIPDQLGEYQFADLTIYMKRTTAADRDTVSDSSEFSIEVLKDKKPERYYLCYRKGSDQFRLIVCPLQNQSKRTHFECIVSEAETWPTNSYFTPWEGYSGLYFEEAEDDKGYYTLMIAPEHRGNYAIFVQKIYGTDCLEDYTMPFSEEEALTIYEAVRETFH